ncbi:MAG: hypothetical protein KJ620_02035 [Candidatus Edwardsbacteria bacterium]|nr:hypothetical protein [Candidatus Edwardsbacteria bacterium]MBU1576664.1 hypothetical protein [Candidatus Edwardsbacteria bacterium]
MKGINAVVLPTITIISLCFLGCSKKTTEPELIPEVTITSLTDTLCISYGSCMLNSTLIYQAVNYSSIKSGSDSDKVDIFLSSNKKLSSPGNGGGCKSVETSVNTAKITTTDTWLPDTISTGLEISDTLSAIDSSVVLISWWYNGKRYQMVKKY